MDATTVHHAVCPHLAGVTLQLRYLDDLLFRLDPDACHDGVRVGHTDLAVRTDALVAATDDAIVGRRAGQHHRWVIIDTDLLDLLTVDDRDSGAGLTVHRHDDRSLTVTVTAGDGGFGPWSDAVGAEAECLLDRWHLDGGDPAAIATMLTENGFTIDLTDLTAAVTDRWQLQVT